MTRHRRTAAALAAAALVLGGAAACGQNSLTGGGGFKDLKGIPPQNPDKTVLVNNVDGFPNVVIVCVSGVALVTTTREAAGALQHVAELDRICPGYVKPAAG